MKRYPLSSVVVLIKIQLCEVGVTEEQGKQNYTVQSLLLLHGHSSFVALLTAKVAGNINVTKNISRQHIQIFAPRGNVKHC